MVLVNGDRPLARLLVDSVEHEDSGAPVARELLAVAAGGAFTLLVLAVAGRFWIRPGTGDWIFFDGIVQWSLSTWVQVATPIGVVAFVLLAIDAALAAGPRVGSWVRTVAVTQIPIAGVAATPAIVLLVLIALTVVVYVALGVLFVVVLFAVLAGALAG